MVFILIYLIIFFPWEMKSPELIVYLETWENRTLTTFAKLIADMLYLFIPVHTNAYLFLACG